MSPVRSSTCSGFEGDTRPEGKRKGGGRREEEEEEEGGEKGGEKPRSKEVLLLFLLITMALEITQARQRFLHALCFAALGA